MIKHRYKTEHKAPSEGKYQYDLLVIGSGPAGQRAAVQAAKIRKKVGIIDKRYVIGGVCVNLGTIPSKSFREAVIYLSGYRQRHIYGSGYRVKSDITMADLTYRCHHVMQTEIDIINAQLTRNHIEVLNGDARFIDQHTLEISNVSGKVIKTADKFVIAVGAKPFRPPNIEFDGSAIFDSDNILEMSEVPRSMLVVGAGVIGAEYGSMFAALGVHVTIIDSRKRLLEFIDQEIVECLQYQMRNNGITLRMGETVDTCSKREDGQVVTKLKSGKVIVTDCVLFSAGRVSATEGMGLEEIGVKLGDRSKIEVDANYCTSVPNIYAAGDVIGFPALASTSSDQGRTASAHAFGIKDNRFHIPLPYGIYAIPEMSTVGDNEEKLTEQGVPYEIGIARFKEIARGHLVGDEEGLLKLIFHRESREILGVHIIGESATELIHIGQSVMALKGGLDYFLNAVFNYPTLAECYKVAALDGYNKIKA